MPSAAAVSITNPVAFGDNDSVNNQPVAFGDTDSVNNQPVAYSGTDGVNRIFVDF